MTEQSLLHLHHISKRFGAVRALTDVHFDVRPAEVVALLGDNGAGKSTLIKIMSGAEMPDEGRIELGDQHVSLNSPSDAGKLGIATVYQDLALCENLDVMANLFLGREVTVRPLRALGWMHRVSMEREARDLLSGLSISVPDVKRPVEVLSGGQRQSIAVARTLMGDTKIVLLDEPTAALGVAQTHQVLTLIGQLRDRGLGIVLVSHNLANVFAIADRAVVLFLGRNIAQFDDLRSTPQEKVVAAITGLEARTDNGEGERSAERVAEEMVG